MQHITNSTFNEEAWSLASLPVRFGGLGIRNVENLTFPAFLGSVNETDYLTSLIIPKYILDKNYPDFDFALKNWLDLCNLNTLPSSCPKTQKDFDNIFCKYTIQLKIENCDNPKSKARLIALQEQESNAWLGALPSPPLGTLLDDSTFRISVGLRLGQPVCGQHTCTCGQLVDILGHHGLCCSNSAGRLSRHRFINEILHRSLVVADTPNILEPNGVCRSDGKRADGLSYFPWREDKQLIWDVTCRDTLAESYISRTSNKAGEAAFLGEQQKRCKYKELLERFVFVPFSVETLGPWGEEAKRLVCEISARIKNSGRDSLTRSFIVQLISLAIQRGNAASILGTIPYQSGLEEMENKAFSKGTETGTELESVVINGVITKKTNTCTPEVCRSARRQFQPPDLANNSPWAKKKTYFFIGTIVLLILWILIYTIVSELKLV